MSCCAGWWNLPFNLLHEDLLACTHNFKELFWFVIGEKMPGNAVCPPKDANIFVCVCMTVWARLPLATEEGSDVEVL